MVLAEIECVEARGILPGHGIVSEKEPESEDWLREDIENGVGDDLCVNVDVAGSISNTPDAA